MITEYPIVFIRWKDHNTHDGMWIETDDIPRGALIVESTGFLIDEDDESYQIVGSVCDTGDKEISRGYWYILKADVVEYKKI